MMTGAIEAVSWVGAMVFVKVLLGTWATRTTCLSESGTTCASDPFGWVHLANVCVVMALTRAEVSSLLNWVASPPTILLGLCQFFLLCIGIFSTEDKRSSDITFLLFLSDVHILLLVAHLLVVAQKWIKLPPAFAGLVGGGEAAWACVSSSLMDQSQAESKLWFRGVVCLLVALPAPYNNEETQQYWRWTAAWASSIFLLDYLVIHWFVDYGLYISAYRSFFGYVVWYALQENKSKREMKEAQSNLRQPLLEVMVV